MSWIILCAAPAAARAAVRAAGRRRHPHREGRGVPRDIRAVPHDVAREDVNAASVVAPPSQFTLY